MKIKNFFLVLCVFPTLLSANIIEIFSLRDVISHIGHAEEAATIVVFDIDNTLVKSTQSLGSVAWGDRNIEYFETKGFSRREAEEVESVFWRVVQPHIKVQAVDPDTHNIIREIQSKNISVICLTARKPGEFEYTQNQLQSIGINLLSHRLLSDFPKSLNLISETMFKNGIIFATPFNKKSHVFSSFLNETQLKPKRVIFIDDKFDHVEDMQKSLETQDIECIGIRFGGADEDVKHFNPKIAEIQWHAFPKLISDEEAFFILKEKMHRER